ncbi:alpha/beta fold hydrolase [Nocardia sp. NPDC046473]|uniref:alpha/beta fold hydrolase n=1 Tax=Nocardia sp. NPDC046473 TaxID=3155733 RepID=UPI0033E18C85
MSPEVVLILIHGINSDPTAWNPMVELLEGDDELYRQVSIVNFGYPTGVAGKLPNLTQIAGRLATEIQEAVPPTVPIVFAAHSQGGLIVQRYVAGQLTAGKGMELQRIRRVLLFATPNSGSQYIIYLRKMLGWILKNDQEKDLRAINAEVTETQRTLFDRVINATVTSATSVPIPFEAYAALRDKVVEPQSAHFLFPVTGNLDGDHSTIIRPTSREDRVYQIVRSRLLEVMSRPMTGAAVGPLAAEPMDAKPPVLIIAEAMSKIEELKAFQGRNAFLRKMPDHISSKITLSPSNNTVLDLGQLVDVCMMYEDDGRRELLKCMSQWLDPNAPAVPRAMTVIERHWPDGQG